MKAQAVVVLVWVAACGSAPPAGQPPERTGTPKVLAPRDVAAVQVGEEDDVETISGTIESIRFQNINKARDHYTYNVELVVARADAEPITVRVDKIYWAQTRQAVRDAIAPDGPKNELRPTTWRGWTVGDEVQLRARVTSPGLAHLVQ